MTVTAEQVRWMREALQGGASTWVDTEDTQAPYELLRSYVERRLERPLRSARYVARDKRSEEMYLKILLLTDIHGNLPALEAVLRHPAAQGADRVVSTGDHTGFGPCPRQVTERLMALNADILAGNHEERLPQADDPAFAGYNWELLRWTMARWKVCL